MTAPRVYRAHDEQPTLARIASLLEAVIMAVQAGGLDTQILERCTVELHRVRAEMVRCSR